LFDVHALAGAAVLAASLYAAYRYRRRPEVVLGVDMLLLGLLPVLNIIPIGEVSAERFLYIPSLGFVLILGTLWTNARTRRSLTGPMTWLLAVTLLAYAGRTVTRNADWKDEGVLFAKTAASSPNSARAQLGMAGAAERRGDIPAAVAAYQRALAIDPDYPDALSNLAGIYVRQGRIDEAQELIERALRTAPGNPRLMTNLGAIYFQKRQFEPAAQQFERVVALDPNEREARFNLALIRYQQEQFDAARGHFEAVAGKGDRFNLAYYYLAVIANTSGDPARAQKLAQHFLTVYPTNDAFRSQAKTLAGP
jgi:tetratricopeptide (TPR) repeat protein